MGKALRQLEFLVFELHDDELLGATEAALQAEYGLRGPLLVPLGNRRFVMPPAGLRLMLRDNCRKQLWEKFDHLAMIRATSFEPGDRVTLPDQPRQDDEAPDLDLRVLHRIGGIGLQIDADFVAEIERRVEIEDARLQQIQAPLTLRVP